MGVSTTTILEQIRARSGRPSGMEAMNMLEGYLKGNMEGLKGSARFNFLQDTKDAVRNAAVDARVGFCVEDREESGLPLTRMETELVQSARMEVSALEKGHPGMLGVANDLRNRVEKGDVNAVNSVTRAAMSLSVLLEAEIGKGWRGAVEKGGAGLTR